MVFPLLLLLLLMLILRLELLIQLQQVILLLQQLLQLGLLLLEPPLQVLRQYFQPQLMQQLLLKVHRHLPESNFLFMPKFMVYF